jgi:hypothetical protein
MRLALEPISYYWPRETVLAFYRAVALSAVDVVYLGSLTGLISPSSWRTPARKSCSRRKR